MIETICYIVLVACGLGMFWAIYLMYLDWIWRWQDNPVESSQWVLLDKNDSEIARYD